MNITPNKLSIAQLFTPANEQFVIPSYQRRYAWTQSQYGALFDDIDCLADTDGHLFGMIILHGQGHHGGLNTPEVVDGQQRLTTIGILLRAIEQRYRDLGDSERADSFQKLTVTRDNNDCMVPKIKLGDLDVDDYRAVLENDLSHDWSNDNIGNAYNDFLEWFVKYDKKELGLFCRKLLDVAVIIRLDVMLDRDAYKLFETINNRGLRLTATDILKNFILGHASLLSNPGVLEKVKKLWSNIIINLDGLDTDDFLRQFICAELAKKVTYSKLVAEFKKHYKAKVQDTELLGDFEDDAGEVVQVEDDEERESEIDDDSSDVDDTANNTAQSEPRISIDTFLARMLAISEIYRQIAHDSYPRPGIANALKNLNSVQAKPTWIFLMKFLGDASSDEKTKIAVIRYIEVLMLRRHICESRTSTNDDIFSKIVQYIGEAEILERIKEYIDENEYMPDNEEFASSFAKVKFKGNTDRARYILAAIEEFKRGNTAEVRISESTQLEHIIPQTIRSRKTKEEQGDWEKYLGVKERKNHKHFVHNIGNLTLLGETLNIKASNNPFESKKKFYKTSSFKITKEISRLPDFKFAQVQKRGQDLAKIALKIWKM